MKFILGHKIFLYVFFLAVLASLSFLYFFDFSQAYNDQTTHPAITNEIIDFYNLFYEPKITDEEKEWIVQGAINEDAIPRWINHFYDPVYKQGWTGEKTGIFPDWFVRSASYALIADKEPVSSLDWLHNQEFQAGYGDFNGNRTWERAIYELAAAGNKKEAYYTLGFILHLIEDATVPEHTRNDTHAAEAEKMTGDEGSPYELYAARFTRENFNISQDLKNAGFKPMEKHSIDTYLLNLANYSNKNFFSKDTIFDEKYEEPKIIRKDDRYGYGQDIYGETFKLFFVKKEWDDKDFKYVSKYNFGSYSDNENQVLHDYFTLLSRQAITNGAGIINLFHQEAEKARQNPDQLKPPLQSKMASQTISYLSEKTKAGWIKGTINMFVKRLARDFVFQPVDNLRQLGASAIDTLLAFRNVDPNLLTIGVGNKENIIDIVEEVEATIKSNVSRVDVVNLTAGATPVIKTLPQSPLMPRNITNSASVDLLDEINQTGKIIVKWVIDGDTFVLSDNIKVRLIGIDAPEQGKCFYGESKDMLEDLVLGKSVRLEKDISETDTYGRLLRYVYINDIFVNDYMIREGYAKEWKYGPDVKYSGQFVGSHNYARDNKLGIWKNCFNIVEEIKEAKPPAGGFASPENGSLDYIIASIGNNNEPPQNSNNGDNNNSTSTEPELGSEPEPEPEPPLEPSNEGQTGQAEPGDTISPIAPFGINIIEGALFTAADDVSTADGAQINIWGQGEAGSITVISVNPVYEAEVATDGTWQTEITLNEGANEIKIKARDQAGNESDEIIVNIVLDSVGPASRINITNYNLMSLVFNVGWVAAEEDAATSTFELQYKIGVSGAWQNLELENGGEFEAEQEPKKYYFRVRVQDINGNQGDWSAIAEAEINTKPAVFSEIAWMGTDSASQNCDGGVYDEWLEIFNMSGSDVDITNWEIIAGDGSPYITIFDASVDSFVIPAGGYFLLERGDNNNISNVDADFIYPIGGSPCSKQLMENGSEALTLKDASGNVIDRIGVWYAGNNSAKRTMERVRWDVSSEIPNNWLNYKGEGAGALDADSNPVLGTPKTQNSVHDKYYSIGSDIVEDTVWTLDKSPYLISTNPAIREGVTLTIEAGVKVMVGANFQIYVFGTLKTLGTENQRIVLTSASDNPQAGDWQKLYFGPTSVNSELRYTDILYGGVWIYGFGAQSAAVEVDSSDVVFNNVLIKESEKIGLWLKNSNSLIANSVFENINYESTHTMIEISGGNPKIIDSVFRNSNGNRSWYGISAQNGAAPKISGNTFSDANYSVIVFGADPVFSENVATGNFHNNIYLYGNNNQIDTDTILEKDLPYLIDSMIYVNNGATLTVNPGVEIQINFYGSYGDGIVVQDGALKAIGTEEERIRFTSGGSTRWQWIYFTEEASSDSELKYVTIENGGAGTYTEGAMIKAEEVDIKLDNVEILDSYSRGLWLENSNSQITNILFKCNGYIDSGNLCSSVKVNGIVPALDIRNSDPIISNTIFKLNRIGIKADEDSNPTFEDIVFGQGEEANYINTDPDDLIPL